MYCIPQYVTKALDALWEAGYEAYVVGGAVRDLLRGREPHDYDITTSAFPEEAQAVFRGYRTVETGLKHGTLTVLIDSHPLEVTTYRIDGGYTDMRHPDAVTFTRSLKEDAARRDFTVNAMAYHPKEGLKDFFGGEADLASRLIRAVGEPRQRFAEDALRILRAMRFASVLDFEIEKDTAAAMRACKDGLLHISPERIREELLKLLCGGAVRRVLYEFKDVLAVILPEAVPLYGFDQKNPHHAFDVFEHTLRATEAAPALPHLRLAAFFHDFGKPSCFSLDDRGVGHFYGHADASREIAEGVLDRLRLDNKTKASVLTLIQMHDVVPDPASRQFTRLRSRHGDAFLSDWLAIVRADRTGQTPSLSAEQDAFLKAAEAARDALLKESERVSLKSLALSGDDLISLGMREGKKIGQILNTALSAVIEGKMKNEKSELLTFAKRMMDGAPIECERKLLIRLPDLSLLRACEGVRESEIVQTYLIAPAGVTARVRARTEKGMTVYTHTEKRRITVLSAEESEREISFEEYVRLLEKKDLSRQPIHKTRFAIPYKEHVLEVDVYPFWKRQAVLEIELKEEDEAFFLPPFIEVLREVSADGRYKNTSLAREVPEEDI